MRRFLSKKVLQTLTSLLRIIALTMFLFGNACNKNNMNLKIVLIAEGDYMYLAQVTKPYKESDTQIHVYIFNDHVREKVGPQISSNKVEVQRTKPPEGWGTRQIAIQYFWNDEWIYTEDAIEFEDHYLISVNVKEKKRFNFKEVRFPIPIKRFEK